MIIVPILKALLIAAVEKIVYLLKGKIKQRLPETVEKAEVAEPPETEVTAEAAECMSLNEFIAKYRGQRVRGGSCVQLFRQYIKDVWNLPPLEGLGEDGGAEGLFTRYDTDVGPLSRKYLERIAFTGDNSPQPGDVLIYRATDTNRWGHVGIFVEPSVRKDTHIIFDQHGFGSQAGDGAQLRSRGVGELLGWLRKR